MRRGRGTSRKIYNVGTYNEELTLVYPPKPFKCPLKALSESKKQPRPKNRAKHYEPKAPAVWFQQKSNFSD